ncbi:protein NRT1/ PTR FAMILY 4.5-like [Senna tora]|uniref:Protein NRT1/ PTR FAMILY 4.5-like n=1 Tax=Senna tora TaxID=362788 RepID=A0A835CEG6_9FABA|nr:protein NRT1/ PTR FAMILY 4.5-like [Senna tora]
MKDVEYEAVKNNGRQGGFRATYFIFAMMFLDNIGFVANMASLVLYFMFKMYFDVGGASTTTTNFLGTAFLLTIVGGFISDTYMTRLNTCLLFGIIQLLGYMLLVIQSHNSELQPQPCGKSSCVRGSKAALFYSSIYLLALGGGGIRGCIPALGADQFDYQNPHQRNHIATFFNWLLLSIVLGATIGVTFVVYASIHLGWDKGFIISMSCSASALIFIALGKPFYRNRIPGDNSPLLRVLQVLVVTLRNWNLRLPQNSDDLYEEKEKRHLPHTNQFRLLDKAAVLLPNGVVSKWRVCGVSQVEEVKILTRMMPILLSTIVMNTCLAQLQTVSVQQGTFMDHRLGNFKVPEASIPVIPLVFMILLIPVYEFAFVPFLRRLTGHPNGITHLQRVGVGLVLSAVSMAVAGAVEVKRKNEFFQHKRVISMFWLSFHYAIFGIADMFTLVGLMEFFYKEAPAGMRSLSTSFSWMSLAIGYYLNSVLVEVINSVTRSRMGNKTGWVEGGNVNQSHVQFFYWFLAVLSVINFVNYVYWARWYKYKEDVPNDEQELLKHDVPSAATPSTVVGGDHSTVSAPFVASNNTNQQE